MKDYNNFFSNIRTDLAVESREIYLKAKGLESIEGIEVEEVETNECKITRVKVLNEKAEQTINKKIGTYINIDQKQDIRYIEEDRKNNVISSIINEIYNIINKDKSKSTLIIGLGNRDVTPDSLGPRIVNNLEITRHIIKYTPEYIDSAARSVSAVSPRSFGNNRY